MVQQPQAPRPIRPVLPQPQEGNFDERLAQVAAEMDNRRKDFLKQCKQGLDLNDVLEIRNPQSVIEFINEIMVAMRGEEERHMYPENFLDNSV